MSATGIRGDGGALRASDRLRTLALPGAALVSVALATAAARYAAEVPGVLLCPLHAATGLWCPFCGSLRGAAALSRGDVTASLSSNVVLLPLVLVSGYWWVVLTLRSWRSGQHPRIPTVPMPVVHVTLAVLATFTLWRNVPALPLAGWLAP